MAASGNTPIPNYKMEQRQVGKRGSNNGSSSSGSSSSAINTTIISYAILRWGNSFGIPPSTLRLSPKRKTSEP